MNQFSKSFTTSKLNFLFLALLLGSLLKAQAPLEVVLGTNNIPITAVQFEYNGVAITQTQGVTSTNTVANAPVLLNFFEINGTDTLYLNDFGNVVRNNNFTSTTSGVGVYRQGVLIDSDDVESFETALDETVNNADLVQFLYYDGQSNVPENEDFDIFFAKGIIAGNYVAVGERNGNTDFSITPLDADGNVIANSETILFGEISGTNSGNGTNLYDWDIGYSPDNYAGQSMNYTIIEANLFNMGTETIFGFRIDNNGNADVKFFGLSEDGFADNPTNPKIGGITGTVFNDSNGLMNSTVDGTAIALPDGVQLYANLYDNSTGDVIASVPISADGTYEFLDLEAGSNYSVSISTNQGIEGAQLPAQNLPVDWEYTGDNTAETPGDDGNPDGMQTSIAVNNDLVPNVNFGIEETPTADPYTFGIDDPIPNSILVVGDLNTADLSGDDPEDGQLGTASSFGITSLPANNNDLIYNGVVITVGQDGINPPSPTNPFVIDNYDPALFEVQFNGDPAQESTSFDYVSIDAAGMLSEPVTYTLFYAALPVEWFSFRVVKMKETAHIEFSTATEINNSHFLVQKSIDGRVFNNIARIEGAVNSTEINNYTYLDNRPVSGINYYRIMQVDLNGDKSYSDVRIISMEEQQEEVSIYPNPVSTSNSVLHVNFTNSEDNVLLVVYNSFGMEVKRCDISDSNRNGKTTLDISDFMSGTYILKVGENSSPIMFTVVN